MYIFRARRRKCVERAVSLVSFILPLLRTRLVIENPSQIYTVKSSGDYDEIIVPVIMTNYGSYIRSINEIECTLEYDGHIIPMRPTYIYDEVYPSQEAYTAKRFYSSFNLEANFGCEKYIGFVFDDSNFNPDMRNKIPKIFHFESKRLYTFQTRFHTTRNHFTKNDREVIQVLYAFEAGDLNDSDSIYNPSKKSWIKVMDKKVFPSYK